MGVAVGGWGGGRVGGLAEAEGGARRCRGGSVGASTGGLAGGKMSPARRHGGTSVRQVGLL